MKVAMSELQKSRPLLDGNQAKQEALSLLPPNGNVGFCNRDTVPRGYKPASISPNGFKLCLIGFLNSLTNLAKKPLLQYNPVFEFKPNYIKSDHAN